ncbi:MAG TPA: hypothetical protein VGV37_29565 [Aliidongia sp.]|uniref:hypothetical protein n=1 Tax=Aliidongia sp. TaxID=1914230 RepID=UPI002DDCEE48|nr:hypothetical protein [Aliidongia sp.]HEV2678713.1 hypothetical protein [Aliidongia sp.]
MPEAYEEAAKRHYTDAKILAAGQRFDNAGHLIGFATECALKHALGLHEPQKENPKLHLPQIVSVMLKRLSSRNPKAATLRTLLLQGQATFFHDYDVSDRYSPNGTVTSAMYEQWESLAKRTFGAAGIRQ